MTGFEGICLERKVGDRVEDCPTPTPTPTAPPPGGGGWGGGYEPPQCDPGGGTTYLLDGQEVGSTGCYSPLLIDAAGDGYALTDAPGGVTFDLNSDGTPEHLGWTMKGDDDAWLALDRDGNGIIDDGREVFGNFTEQPPSAHPNGFLALAEFDSPLKGGNSDGVIDARDAIFDSLRLWRDSDHDGFSDQGELYELPELDVARLHLDYKESKRVDERGNWFRYRARLDDAKGAKVNRWMWDVFLVSAQ